MNSPVSPELRTWMRSAAILGSTNLGLLGCSPLEIPEGPDLTSLQEEYDHPTGGLTQEEVQEVVARAQAIYADIMLLGKLGFTIDTLDNVDDALDQFASRNGGGGKGRFKLDAVTRTRTICPGHGSRATTEPENGNLEMTLTIERTLLNATIWGAFDSCELRHDIVGVDTAVTMHGDLGIGLTGKMHLSEVDLSSILISYVGTLEVFDTSTGKDGIHEMDLNFRLVGEEKAEVSVPASVGNVIFAFGADGLQAEVRTVGGSFCCTFAERECAAIVGDQCGDPASGDTTLTW